MIRLQHYRFPEQSDSTKKPEKAKKELTFDDWLERLLIMALGAIVIGFGILGLSLVLVGVGSAFFSAPILATPELRNNFKLIIKWKPKTQQVRVNKSPSSNVVSALGDIGQVSPLSQSQNARNIIAGDVHGSVFYNEGQQLHVKQFYETEVRDAFQKILGPIVFLDSHFRAQSLIPLVDRIRETKYEILARPIIREVAKEVYRDYTELVEIIDRETHGSFMLGRFDSEAVRILQNPKTKPLISNLRKNMENWLIAHS